MEGNWQVRVRRGFGCGRTSPFRGGPSPETVIGAQNCTWKQMRTMKFWGDLLFEAGTPPYPVFSQPNRFIPSQDLLYCYPWRLWGSPDVMNVKILAQCLAHGWEMWAVVTKHMRIESQMKEEEKHMGDFQGCCGLGKSPLEAGAQTMKPSVIVNKYQK